MRNPSRNTAPENHHRRHARSPPRPGPHNPGFRIMRIAQGVLSGGVSVVRRPRVVDGGAGESRQDAHAVHRFGTALAVEEQSAVARGGGGVQPMVTAFAAQPGFVEVDDQGGFDAGVDLGQEFGEITGGAGGHGGDGAVGHRNAEQFADGLGGALLGQELSHEQVDDDGAHHRPVLHGCGGLGRGEAGGGLPAGAAAADDLVFGDVHLDRRDVEDLPAGAVHLGGAGEVGSAAAAAGRFVADHHVRVRYLGQGLSAVTVLPTGFAFRGLAQRPGRGLSRFVRGRWFRGVL